MKKASILLVLILLSALFAPCGLAAVQKCGDAITWNYNSSTHTLTLTGYGPMYDYTSGKSPWYSKRESIYTIVVNSGITSVGDYAFERIRGSVSLPDTIETIGSHAFYNNYSLTQINLSDRLTQIGDSAFDSCHILGSVNLPEGVVSIGYSAFCNCMGLQFLTLPETLTQIPDYAFFGCHSLQTFELPRTLTSIGNRAFGECNNIGQLVIPASTTSIGNCALSYSCALTDIQVDPGNTCYRSEDGVLFDITGSTLISYPGGKADVEYVVPASVTSIDAYAFSGACHLEHITLPSGLSSIGAYAFAGSYTDLYDFKRSVLSHVDIPDSVTEIGPYAFRYCQALTELVIPEGITTIHGQTFEYSGLRCLSVPRSVTSIEANAFQHCPNGLTIRLIAGSFIEGFAKENGFQVEYVFPVAEADMVLPGDLTAIDDEAFMGTDAAVVSIPAGVTEIGSRAFADCPNLKHINLPEGAVIAGDAFDGCGAVYLYGVSGGPAEAYAAGHDNVIFVPLTP